MNESLILVIFGITGDLSQRKLLPAIYNLLKNGELSCDLTIVGVTRRRVSSSVVYERLEEFNGSDSFDENIKSDLINQTKIFQMELDDESAYENLLNLLHEIESRKNKSSTRLYYLSIPPEAFIEVVEAVEITDSVALKINSSKKWQTSL